MKILQKLAVRSSSAFMLPAVILIMSVMMIVGSVALMQASNVLNIATGLGDLSTARSAAKAGAEYAQVTFNNTTCWVGTIADVGGNKEIVPVQISDTDISSKKKIEFVVYPDDINIDPCEEGSKEVNIEGRVYSSQTSTNPTKVFRIRTELSNYATLGSGMLLAGGGGNAGISGATHLKVSGKDLFIGIYGNVDRGDHFLCLDLSKEDTGEDSQTCTGPTGDLAKELTYVPSDTSNVFGQGENQFMSIGSAGNVGSKPFFHIINEGLVYARYYFAAHNLGGNGYDVNNDSFGFVCVEITHTAIVQPCGTGRWKQLDLGWWAAPHGISMNPNNTFDGPIQFNGKLYGLAARAKPGLPWRKMHCWDIASNGVCAGSPYAVNLEDWDPELHKYTGDVPYGMYSVSLLDNNSGKVYWSINYNTFATIFETYFPAGNSHCAPWWVDPFGCWRNQYIGTKTDCFNLNTNTKCTPRDNNGLTMLDGDSFVPGSNTKVHSVVFQTFFRKDQSGNPVSVCLSVSRDPYYYLLGSTIQRMPLKCYKISDQKEDTSAELTKLSNDIENSLGSAGIRSSFNMGVMFDDFNNQFQLSGNRTYFAYVAFDDPYNDPIPGDALPVRTDLPQPKRERSVGFCWDWSKPGGGDRCDGGWPSENRTWYNAPPVQNENYNLLVAGFVGDQKCLIGVSAANYSSGLFGINPVTGEETCDPSSPKKVY